MVKGGEGREGKGRGGDFRSAKVCVCVCAAYFTNGKPCLVLDLLVHSAVLFAGGYENKYRVYNGHTCPPVHLP